MEDDELDDSMVRGLSAKRKNSRKRSLFEYDNDIDMDDDGKPPQKRKKLQETRKWIENRGVDMFYKVLDEGVEKDQEVLMDLVARYH